MSRRATLPGADERVARTSDAPAEDEASLEPAPAPVALAPAQTEAPEEPAPVAPAGASVPGSPTRVRTTPKRRARAGDLRPTGRERHEEKITVYVSPEELVALEQAKLALRAQHGMAVDRGRIVREAVAVVIADLEAKGEESILVRRLRGL